MKIKKSELLEIIREELLGHVGSLLESPKGHQVHDAHSDKVDQEQRAEEQPEDGQEKRPGPPAKKEPQSKVPSKTPPSKKDAQEDPPEQEVPADPVDGELEKTDDEAETGKKRVGDQITGKMVQSVTTEPKSKILPGAQEIVIAFQDTPDPLRIIVTKTGKVAYFFRGLHNEL